MTLKIYLECFKNSAAICLSDNFFGNFSTSAFKKFSNKQTAAEFVENFNQNSAHKSSPLTNKIGLMQGHHDWQSP